MTKVKTPEPVAEICSDYDLHWAGSGAISPLCERTGAKVGSLLITATQAEAYADARVREALERAESQIMKMHEQAVKARVHPDQAEEGWNESCADRAIALGEAVLAIRALIPPLPGPVEPTT